MQKARWGKSLEGDREEMSNEHEELTLAKLDEAIASLPPLPEYPIPFDLIDYIEVNPAQLKYIMEKFTQVDSQGINYYGGIPIILAKDVPYGVCKIHRKSVTEAKSLGGEHIRRKQSLVSLP